MLLSFRKFSAVAAIVGLLVFVGCERNQAPPIVADLSNAEALRQEFAGAGGDAAGGAVKEVAQPTGFATIKGRFTVSGSVPAPSTLAVSGGDAPVCAPGGKLPVEQSVVVGEDGALANVLVYLNSDIPLDDPKWVHQSYAESADSTVEFDQKQCVFLSHVFAIRTSQEMKILNSDPIGHNTNIQPRKGANSFNQTIPANGAVGHDPGGESPDPFPVTCSIHPWMKAWMITRDSPYFAVTGKDGSFEIANVPAGVELELRVWQEKAGFLEDVTVNGSQASWSRGKFDINLQPNETKEMQVVLDAGVLK